MTLNVTAVLERLYPDHEWSVNGNTYEGLVWYDKRIPKPSKAEITNAWLRTKRDLVKREIKAEAGHRIVSVTPEHRQRNITASGLEFLVNLLIAKGVITSEDIASMSGELEQWAQIKTVRAKSAVAEAEVDASSEAQLDTFDPKDPAHWA